MNTILLSLKDVKKSYHTQEKEIHALNGVSLDVYKGEILGLLGVNGAGKTTLSSIIATLHPLTSGSIHFNGSSIYENIIAYRYQLGFCPQIPNIDPSFTVDETLTVAGMIFNMSKKAIEERKRYLFEKLSLSEYIHSTVSVLSGGYKKRFLIARALMHSPKIVLLDEPTVGLDPHIRRQLWDVIAGLKKEGVTVILTTHYLDEAEVLSDRVCILDKGFIKFLETPNNLKMIHEKGNLEDVFLELMKKTTIKKDEI